MAITIVKKGAAGLPPAARVIEDQEAKDKAKPEYKPVPPPEDSKQWWEMRMPGINQKPSLCAFCQKMYVMPCDDNTHLGCGNWFELEKKRIAKEKPNAS